MVSSELSEIEISESELSESELSESELSEAIEVLLLKLSNKPDVVFPLTAEEDC